MKIDEKIAKLRKLMEERGMDYYVIPSSDYHQSEYVGEYFKSRKWISGFTGSAGTVVVTKDKVGLWTDGRYFIQAAKQIEGTEITLFKWGELGVPSYMEYIKENIKENECLGFDGKTMSYGQIKDFKNDLVDKNIKINGDYDLVGEIWEDRPSLAATEAFVLDTKYAGEDVKSKISRIREVLEKENSDTTILSSLDDIAWIFNLRGHDISNNPVNMAYAMISRENVILYIEEKKLNKEVEEYLATNGIEVRDYWEIYQDVAIIPSSDVVLVDFGKINYKIVSDIPNGVKILNRPNPSTLMKACKNETEIENLKRCHVKDGVAVVKFMYWLKNNIGKIDMSEISATEVLEGFRKEQELYIEPSFDTICAYGPNAAMMHYKAVPEHDATLEQRGLLLVDSGGQYLDGTTDITRTFVLGECSEELKKHFTLVLKGMIKLSKVKFMHGVTGTNLDILAREALWAIGIDYKCGTGHGVGFLLNVHEGPQGIRVGYNPQKLEAGMNITNEPGVYIEGSHGIRLENELIVRNDIKTEFGQFMKFETMTYAPLDLDGVLPELLSDEEKEFLNEYHKMVFDKVSPFLTEDEKTWLAHYTRVI